MSIGYSQIGKQMKHEKKCKHWWEISDKWIDQEGITYWEFYCKNCLAIDVKTDKKVKK